MSHTASTGGLADWIGITRVYVAGGTLLAGAGALGLLLLGNLTHDRPPADSSA